MTKRRYNQGTRKKLLAYDDIDYPLAFGSKTTPESGSAMLVLAVLAQATKEGDNEFILDPVVNRRCFRWLGIQRLGHLFKEVQCLNE